MYTILIISLLIIFIVLLLSVVTTSKAYQFQHKVDPLPTKIDDIEDNN